MATFKSLRDLASLEQTRIGIPTPSACTLLAVENFRSAMSQLETVATDFLDWVAGGATGSTPDMSGLLCRS